MSCRFSLESSVRPLGRSPYLGVANGVLLWALVFQPAASAQESVIQETAPVLTPPRLTSSPEVEAPVDLTSPAQVTLQLTISREGEVTEALISDAPSETLGQLAQQAALRFRFEPATRDGQPINARITYRLAIYPRIRPLVPPDVDFDSEDSAAPEGRLEGLIELEGAPCAEGSVRIEGEDFLRELELAEGAFALDVPPGDYAVSASCDGATSEVDATETVVAGEATSVVYRLSAELEASDDEPTYEATAVVDPPPREVSRRVLEADVLTRIPGTRGDALRAVELLPGVGRPAFGGGNLIIRGAAPGDSEVFLDGAAVPLLYHFGGITSFYNSLLLERIDFVPGNFSVRFGRKIGGILEVEPRDPRTDGFHGFVDLNLLDASVMAETPVGPNLAVAVAARRSYIDFFFREIIPQGTFNVLAAPVYFDYQAIVTWRPDPRHRVRLLIYGSSDDLSLVFGNPSDSDPAVRGNFGISTEFHRVQASWRFTEGPIQQDVMVAFGLNDTAFGIGDNLRFNGQFLPLTLRSETRVALSDRARIVFGLDSQWTPLDLSFRGPQSGQAEGDPSNDPLQGSSSIDVRIRTEAYRPAVYLESQLRPTDQLDVVLGVRADYFRDVTSWSVDPRLTGRFRFNSQWALRAGVGLYSQPPEFQESSPAFGNADLSVLTSVHAGAGGDFRLPEYNFQLTLDGFYKHIYDRPVSTQGSIPPFFENGGLGRIYGMELGARMTPGGPLPFFGFLSYTLSRSERNDRPDQGGNWRLFDFDQTHILTLAWVWTIGDGWEAGLTFRLVSGNPLTPVTGANFDSNLGLYRPTYGAVNSERNPFFHRLDLRVQKTWRIGDGRVSIYLDIQNVYNATNREGVTYSYDYRQSADVNGLPILPTLGIRGEL